MKTAAAATSASLERGAADRQAAGRRLKELAANLVVHRGFADVVASLEAGHAGASDEQSFEEFISRDAEMSGHIAQNRGNRADA
jgi:hypothetical protein